MPRTGAFSHADLRATFPTGTVLHDPVTGEYGRLVEHTRSCRPSGGHSHAPPPRLRA